MPVAGEQADLLPWQQGGRVQQVAEGERAGAALELEPERHLDWDDLRAAAGDADQRPERELVGDVELVAGITRLQRWAAPHGLPRRGFCDGHDDSPSSDLAA